MPLVVGEFDLSIGNMLGFLTMLGAFLGGQGYDARVVIPVMLLGGVAVGLINGFLTVYFQISSFIATLGTGILLSGFTLGLSGGQVLFDGIPAIDSRDRARSFSRPRHYRLADGRDRHRPALCA